MSNFVSLGDYEYNPADILGNGAFAIVYKGHEKDNLNKHVAIKRMVKEQNNIKSISLLKKEISVLKELNNENIVQLFSHNISPNCVYLVMEYCNGGDLSEYLLKLKTLSEDTIRSLLSQIGSAMNSMHQKGIIHRDLKPSNILLCYNSELPVIKGVSGVPANEINFKLADFGFARFLQDGMMAATMCGSPMYMAPEVLMCSKYNSLADIWSMGIIVFQCLTGKAPFFANTPEALKDLYVRTSKLVPKIPATTSQELHDLLLKMLVRNPKERINYESFLNHSFVIGRNFKLTTNPVGKSGGGTQVHPLRSNSGDDLRTVTYSTQEAKCYYSRKMSYDASRALEIPNSRPIPISDRKSSDMQRRNNSPVKIQDDFFDEDFVIVNKDGSVSEGLSIRTDNRSSCEVPINLIGPCNTSPDFRQNFLDSGLQSQGNISPTNPTVPLRNTNSTRIRPPSCPNLLPIPRVLTRKLSINEDNCPQLPSPSEPKFFLGSLGRKRTSSYNGCPPTSPTNDVIFRAPSDSTNQSNRNKPTPIKEAIKELTGGVSVPEDRMISSRIATFGNLQECQPFSFDYESFTPEKRSCTAPADVCSINELDRYRTSSLPSERSNSVNRIDPALLVQPPPLLEENIMEPEHTETIKSVCSILELCEILMELAELRSMPLSMSELQIIPLSFDPSEDDGKLKFASEAQRVIEQIVLYKQILYCLEVAFKEFRNAFESQKLKATIMARKKLHECNTIYHRCYIRLRNLAREARRNDLLSEARVLSKSISADRLIFQYAGFLFSAAETDEYSGEVSMSLSRYRNCATLLHGLCRFCDNDKVHQSGLYQLFELVQNKYNRMCSLSTVS